MQAQKRYAGFSMVAAVLSLATCTSIAHAELIYDTFGPGDTYNSSQPWGNGNYLPGVLTENAFPFFPGSGSFSDISITLPLAWLNLFQLQVPPPDFSVSVYADNGNADDLYPVGDSGGPGTLLGVANASGSILPMFTGQNVGTLTFDFPSVTVTGGERYWVAISVDTSAETGVGWFMELNSVGMNGNFVQRFGDEFGQFSNWVFQPAANVNGAMRVEGTPVPTPSVVALLGFAGLTARRRRRRRPSVK